ncbi:MAG: LPXTG cell wall anchor domain-containing protein [Rubrobacter sp.]
MKKVMLVAAMLAMVLAAAVPALAQSVTQIGEGNVACVQTAVQQEFGKVQISQYGDNVNIQNISQECNISVTEVETVIASATATATASATASATATATASATASASSAPAVQYQYAAPDVQYSASASSAPAAELPSTGGSSLIALGAGVLLVAGGLLARRIVR